MDIEVLEIFLDGYHDKAWVLEGFRCGFSIGYEGPYQPRFTPNSVSTLKNPKAVDDFLAKETASGRIKGPFEEPPFQVMVCSSLNMIPKSTPGQFRPILDLSLPKGISVNDCIPQVAKSTVYPSVQDAVLLIQKLGPGCFLAKEDFKAAFRQIGVKPEQYWLLGLEWKGSFFHDTVLPQGCASSCQIFQRVAQSIKWACKYKLNIPFSVHYLDDTLIIASSKSECERAAAKYRGWSGAVGLIISPEKSAGPAQVLEFLGITLDTVRFESRLPADKIEKCRSYIAIMLRSVTTTLLDLQVVTGLLSFACAVVEPGRAFLRRLFDLQAGATEPRDKIRLEDGAKSDLRIWLVFLEKFNGVTIFPDRRPTGSTELHLFTDAAKSGGYGAMFGTKWISELWGFDVQSVGITWLEFFPIVLSLQIWGPMLRNRSIVFHTDNSALTFIINKQTAKNKNIMKLVREMVLVCLRMNIIFRAKHIPGAKNVYADLLSRQDSRKTVDVPKHLDQHPTRVPHYLLPERYWSEETKS